MLRRVRLHLLPPAVAAILVVTAVPVDIGTGRGWTGWPNAADTIANVLLFLPFGAALCRRRLLEVFAIAFALSCTIELIQHWSIGRYTSPFDVLANTLGGLAGAVLWKALHKSRGDAAALVTLGPFAQAALAVLCVAIAAVWLQPGRSSALIGWDASYALMLGAERTGQRGWHGVVEAVALIPKALGGAVAEQLSAMAPEQWRDVVPRATLLDTTRRSLGLQDTPVHLPEEAARDLTAQASAANALTIVARVHPASVQQWGSARILSFSGDPQHRNFDLEQERDRVVFRVRTPISGENGGRLRIRTEAVLKDRSTTLVATYDGAVARVYVDGRLAARRNLAAAGCRVRAVCDGGAHLAWSIIGATAALLAFAALGAFTPFAAWAVGLGGGALLSALALSLAGDARIVPAAWSAFLPLAGALMMALSVHWGANRPMTAASADRQRGRPVPR
jgi:hypothetical protein